MSEKTRVVNFRHDREALSAEYESESASPGCKEEAQGFRCTRPKGHRGRHVAGGGPRTVCAVWDTVSVEYRYKNYQEDPNVPTVRFVCDPAPPADKKCGRIVNHWTCTRAKGHSDEHEAWAYAGTDRALCRAVWEDVEEE